MAHEKGEGICQTCIEASDRSSLFAWWCYVAFEAALYPIAILQAYSVGCRQGIRLLPRSEA